MSIQRYAQEDHLVNSKYNCLKIVLVLLNTQILLHFLINFIQVLVAKETMEDLQFTEIVQKDPGTKLELLIGECHALTNQGLDFIPECLHICHGLKVILNNSETIIVEDYPSCKNWHYNLSVHTHSSLFKIQINLNKMIFLKFYLTLLSICCCYFHDSLREKEKNI